MADKADTPQTPETPPSLDHAAWDAARSKLIEEQDAQLADVDAHMQPVEDDYEWEEGEEEAPHDPDPCVEQCVCAVLCADL